MSRQNWTDAEIIDADGYDVSKIEPNIAAYYTVNNELHSMPFNSSTPLLYYNKDMFDKAGITDVPTSLEEMLSIGIPGILERTDRLFPGYNSSL